MKRLKVSVTKVLGQCTSTPPMAKGDHFTVANGDLRIPAGGFVCAWALQSILPLLPAKERKIGERRKDDWMWRVHHVQCPDPNGRVVFRIEKMRDKPPLAAPLDYPGESEAREKRPDAIPPGSGTPRPGPASPSVRPLRIVVAEVRGQCTSGLRRGDAIFLHGCRLSIPEGRHFCLYALQAVLPFLAAKARPLEDGDWLKKDDLFICPDPAGNVVLRIEVL